MAASATAMLRICWVGSGPRAPYAVLTVTAHTAAPDSTSGGSSSVLIHETPLCAVVSLCGADSEGRILQRPTQHRVATEAATAMLCMLGRVRSACPPVLC